MEIDTLTIRIEASQKKAIRLLAAEQGFSNMSDYVLHILRNNTEMVSRAGKFFPDHEPQVVYNEPQKVAKRG